MKDEKKKDSDSPHDGLQLVHSAASITSFYDGVFRMRLKTRACHLDQIFLPLACWSERRLN